MSAESRVQVTYHVAMGGSVTTIPAGDLELVIQRAIAEVVAERDRLAAEVARYRAQLQALGDMPELEEVIRRELGPLNKGDVSIITLLRELVAEFRYPDLRAAAAPPSPPAEVERRFLAPMPCSLERCGLCGKHIRNHFGATEYRCDPLPPSAQPAGQASAWEDAAREAGCLVSLQAIRDQVNNQSAGRPNISDVTIVLIEHINAALVQLYKAARRG